MANNPALLLTRPRAASERFLATLSAKAMQGVTCAISPLIEIVPTGASVTLGGLSGVLFTSANALPFAPEGAEMPAYCVGARTAQAAAARGYRVVLVSETAEDLLADIDGVQGPLLHLAGHHRRGELAERLSARGVPTKEVVIYDQLARDLSADARALLQSGQPVLAPLFSPRTAEQFRAQGVEGGNLTVVAMSTAVVEALGGLAVEEMHILQAPTAFAMQAAVEQYLTAPRLP